MSGKMITGYLNLDRLMPKTRFRVNMATRIDSLQKDQEVFVKMFLPKNSQHQQIQQIVSKTGGLDFYKEQMPGVG